MCPCPLSQCRDTGNGFCPSGVMLSGQTVMGTKPHMCAEPGVGTHITSPVTKRVWPLSGLQMCNAEQVLAQARKRKRRTSIETNVKGTLESFFRKCVKPSPQEISQIAEDLNLDKDVGSERSEGGLPAWPWRS